MGSCFYSFCKYWSKQKDECDKPKDAECPYIVTSTKESLIEEISDKLWNLSIKQISEILRNLPSE